MGPSELRERTSNVFRPIHLFHLRPLHSSVPRPASSAPHPSVARAAADPKPFRHRVALLIFRGLARLLREPCARSSCCCWILGCSLRHWCRCCGNAQRGTIEPLVWLQQRLSSVFSPPRPVATIRTEFKPGFRVYGMQLLRGHETVAADTSRRLGNSALAPLICEEGLREFAIVNLIHVHEPAAGLSVSETHDSHNQPHRRTPLPKVILTLSADPESSGVGRLSLQCFDGVAMCEKRSHIYVEIRNARVDGQVKFREEHYILPVYDTRTYIGMYDTPFANTVIEATRVHGSRGERGACMGRYGSESDTN